MTQLERTLNRFKEVGYACGWLEYTADDPPNIPKYKQLDEVYVNFQIGILKFFIIDVKYIFVYDYLQPIYRGYHIETFDKMLGDEITGTIISYTENEVIGKI